MEERHGVRSINRRLALEDYRRDQLACPVEPPLPTIGVDQVRERTELPPLHQIATAHPIWIDILSWGFEFDMPAQEVLAKHADVRPALGCDDLRRGLNFLAGALSNRLQE